MQHMLSMLNGLLALLLSTFGYLYERAARERRALAEYSQFLLLNPDSYADQRRKFVEYLVSTQETAPMDARRAIVRTAQNQVDEIAPANVVSRNKAAARK